MTSIQDTVAKAIAWRDLTDKGRKHCVWPDDFAESELKEYRGVAATAIGVLLQTAAEQNRQMLPNKATDEMWAAGKELNGLSWTIDKCYSAMFEAAPEFKWREQ